MDAYRVEGSGCASRLGLFTCAVLGTLVLSVPSTTLLVMYFMQNDGQLSPTGQVPSQSLGRQSEKLHQDNQVTKHRTSWHQQNLDKPTAHLIGIEPKREGQSWTLEWEATPAFSLHRSTLLHIPRQGLYYVYCQVGFRNNSCPPSLPLTIFSKVFHRHDAYHLEPVLLLQGSDTVCGRQQGGGKTWYTSLSQGALVLLEQGHQLYVNVSHPRLVDYQEGKTFFGFMMIS